jgi:hypothetical protein
VSARSAIFSTTSASIQWSSFCIANRDSAAPGGSVIANRPSRTRASGLWKYRCSSVYASGPSTTARASSRASTSPVPSDPVSDIGGPSSGASESYAIAAAATLPPDDANVAVDVPVPVPVGIGDAHAAIRVRREAGERTREA